MIVEDLDNKIHVQNFTRTIFYTWVLLLNVCQLCSVRVHRAFHSYFYYSNGYNKVYRNYVLCSKIYELSMYYFLLSDMLPTNAFSTQPKLLSLNLTGNVISDIKAGAFNNMTRLVRLILTKNRISRLNDQALTGETGSVENLLIQIGSMSHQLFQKCIFHA